MGSNILETVRQPGKFASRALPVTIEDSCGPKRRHSRRTPCDQGLLQCEILQTCIPSYSQDARRPKQERGRGVVDARRSLRAACEIRAGDMSWSRTGSEAPFNPSHTIIAGKQYKSCSSCMDHGFPTIRRYHCSSTSEQPCSALHQRKIDSRLVSEVSVGMLDCHGEHKTHGVGVERIDEAVRHVLSSEQCREGKRANRKATWSKCASRFPVLLQ